MHMNSTPFSPHHEARAPHDYRQAIPRDAAMPTKESIGLITSATNLPHWLEQHKAEMLPPKAHALLFASEHLVILLVSGPNPRIDFHVNESDEFLYQLVGDMKMRMVLQNKVQEAIVRQGETLLVPAGVPHHPVREQGTVGLVVERRRGPDEFERFQWYCNSCTTLLHEIRVCSTEVGKDLTDRIAVLQKDPALRSCRCCPKAARIE